MRKRVCRLLAVLFACALLPTPARATVAVAVPPEDLAEDADAVVTGHVTRIAGHWDPAQAQVFTTIAIRVDDVLKGEVADPEIEVVQPGGVVGSLGSWLQGSPEFEVGERVLVFLTEQADGSVRVSHLYLGKYSIVTDIETGDELAVRDPNPAGVLVLPGPDGPVLSPEADAEVLDAMKAKVRQHAARGKPGKRLRKEKLRGQLAPATTEASTAFRLYGNPTRWWDPDLGRPVTFRINSAGEPLAPTRGFGQVRDALAAWSSVPGSSLRLADGGTTTAQGIGIDSVNAISFRDPYNQIGSPGRGCSGILAMAAHFYLSSSTKVVNGKTFYRIIEGDVVTNKGWEGCGFYEVYANFAEVITHELGHTVGFDHAADRNATMYGVAHFDGRGAALTSTDQAGVVFVYPGTGGGTTTFTLSVVKAGTGQGTVQSSPAGVTCGADCSEAFPSGATVDLAAAPASGSTFAGWSGACTGTGACRVTLAANTSVTATFTAAAGATGSPDLVVSALSPPSGPVAPGSRFKIADTVHNRGDGVARGSRVAYFLVPAGDAGGTRQPLKTKGWTRELAPGQAITSTRAVAVPRTVSPGAYGVLACADDGNAVAEADETNNCRLAPDALTVGYADLRVAQLLGAPARVQRGAPFEITDTTRNDGALDAPATSVGYYLSRTASLAPDAIALRNRSLPALAAGADSTGSATVKVPAKVPTGAYFVIGCVKGPAGDDPANNCLASPTKTAVDP